MHPADTLTQIVLDGHRERTQPAHRVDEGGAVSMRVRAAAGLRRAADRLDAGRPDPESLLPLAGPRS
jgi:hypothetical protein